MKILITGGTGFIGSHTVIELVEQNHEVVIVDNLSNSNIEVLERLNIILDVDIPFYQIDCQDTAKLDEIFKKEQFDAVIHFASLKSVGESIGQPILYYHNNLISMLGLCDVMQANNVKHIIFSSSAVLYGNTDELPVKETTQTGQGLSNPYGQTKYMLEQVLQDIAVSDPEWRIVMLRYFNPIGAHPSGLIGESPSSTPDNLMPYITQVANGEQMYLRVFGNDYPTPDGTGVRDFIHVVDLAKGHCAALDKIHNQKDSTKIYNLGTGSGTSVLELVNTFVQVNETAVPLKFAERRASDIAVSYADASKAERELDWTTTKTVADACEDAWRWQKNSKKPIGVWKKLKIS